MSGEWKTGLPQCRNAVVLVRRTFSRLLGWDTGLSWWDDKLNCQTVRWMQTGPDTERFCEHGHEEDRRFPAWPDNYYWMPIPDLEP